MAKGILRLVLAVLAVQALQLSCAIGQQKKPAANAIPASKSHMPKLYVVQNQHRVSCRSRRHSWRPPKTSRRP